eukprot:1175756-Prorocentrum_minimum.AAC.5
MGACPSWEASLLRESVMWRSWYLMFGRSLARNCYRREISRDKEAGISWRRYLGADFWHGSESSGAPALARLATDRAS